MNRFTKVLFFCGTLFLTLAFGASAQTTKIAVVDSPYINQILTTSHAQQLELTKEELQLYQEIDTYGKNNLRVDSKKEEVSKAAEHRQFYEKATAKRKNLNSRKQALQQTIMDQIKLAIQQVAQEHNYTLVLELQQAPYYSHNDDISKLVLQKLGVK